jgi:hypothetical protein
MRAGREQALRIRSFALLPADAEQVRSMGYANNAVFSQASCSHDHFISSFSTVGMQIGEEPQSLALE